jgi:hypothetical protein
MTDCKIFLLLFVSQRDSRCEVLACCESFQINSLESLGCYRIRRLTTVCTAYCIFTCFSGLEEQRPYSRCRSPADAVQVQRQLNTD